MGWKWIAPYGASGLAEWRQVWRKSASGLAEVRAGFLKNPDRLIYGMPGAKRPEK
jgi:hypothetical protein